MSALQKLAKTLKNAKVTPRAKTAGPGKKTEPASSQQRPPSTSTVSRTSEIGAADTLRTIVRQAARARNPREFLQRRIAVDKSLLTRNPGLADAMLDSDVAFERFITDFPKARGTLTDYQNTLAQQVLPQPKARTSRRSPSPASSTGSVDDAVDEADFASIREVKDDDVEGDDIPSLPVRTTTAILPAQFTIKQLQKLGNLTFAPHNLTACIVPAIQYVINHHWSPQGIVRRFAMIHAILQVDTVLRNSTCPNQVEMLLDRDPMTLTSADRAILPRIDVYEKYFTEMLAASVQGVSRTIIFTGPSPPPTRDTPHTFSAVIVPQPIVSKPATRMTDRRVQEDMLYLINRILAPVQLQHLKQPLLDEYITQNLSIGAAINNLATVEILLTSMTRLQELLAMGQISMTQLVSVDLFVLVDEPQHIFTQAIGVAISNLTNHFQSLQTRESRKRVTIDPQPLPPITLTKARYAYTAPIRKSQPAVASPAMQQPDILPTFDLLRELDIYLTGIGF